MAENDVKTLHGNKSSKNTDVNWDGNFRSEQTERDNTAKEFQFSKGERPDRCEIAVAAEAREKEEKEKRKAAKEKDERQKEAARKAEEEKIAAKKRRAAEAGEALEKKEAQKDARARAGAKTAAEGRAEREAETEIVAEAAAGKRAPSPAADEGAPRPSADEGAPRPAADEGAPRPAAAINSMCTAPGFSQIKEEKNINGSEDHISKGNTVKNVALGKCCAAKIHCNVNEEESLGCSPLPLKNENQQRETVRTSDEKLSGKENGEGKSSQRLSNRTAGQKEGKRAEKKEIVVADAGETQEREAKRAALAEAAERRLRKVASLDTCTTPGSSQNERDKETINTSKKHMTKESSEDVRPEKCDVTKSFGNIKEERLSSPTRLSPKIEKQNRETISVLNDKQTLRERDKDKHGQYNRNIKQGTVKEKDPVNTAKNQAKPQEIKGVHQSVFRSEEGIDEHSYHAEKSQARQNNDKMVNKSSINTIHQNENAKYKQEKEIVSVRADDRNKSKGAESIMLGDQRDEIDRSKKSESFRGKDQKLYSQCTEPDKQNRVKDTQMETNKDHSQRYQNDQTSHDRCNAGDNRGYRQQDNHSQKGQQHYMPPAQRDRSSQQNHRKQSQQNSYSHTPWFSRSLICGICNMKYSLSNKIPRNLYCGHSVCTPCINMNINKYFAVDCPDCPRKTWYARNAVECPVNQPLVNILYDEMQQDAVMEKGNAHFSVGNDTRQSQSHPGSDAMAGGAMKQPESKSVAPRSPHGSKCLEMGVHPSSYCVTCQMWLCNRCAEAEHSTKRCSLRPFNKQLSEMKQKHESLCKKAHEQLSNYLHGLESNLDQDRIFLLWMKTATECTKKRLEDMKNKLKEGRKQLKTLTDVMDSVSRPINFHEALATFQEMSDVAGVAQQWASGAELIVTGADQETTACLRHLMKRTLRSLLVNNGISEMFAVNKIPDGDLFSELRDEGGRFHLHALKKGQPSKQRTQPLPLQCFKSCQAADSTLVFLDLSWGGINRGRLYIRLTGDTLRGRRFISLCTGEEGISFRGTCFHRVWWKGLPGEHVWTGDHEKGDGSGKGSLLAVSGQEQVPSGREVLISAGLVAGRYEKDMSSIFRVYTRAEKEGRDGAGFGQVEFGLDVLREAVGLKNIMDVVISDCGLVLEM